MQISAFGFIRRIKYSTFSELKSKQLSLQDSVYLMTQYQFAKLRNELICALVIIIVINCQF
jgi:hypothetical protein